MAQYGLPNGDTDGFSDNFQAQYSGAGDGDANWFDECDEGFGAGRGTGSGPDDATTCWSLGFGSGEATSAFGVTLTSVTDPASSTGHVARGRFVKTTASTSSVTPSATGKQKDAYVSLRQGTSTEIAQANTANVVDSWITVTINLTGTQADSITNYADLRIRVWAQDVGGGAGRYLAFSAMEFECPDAAPTDKAIIFAHPTTHLMHVLVR